MQTKLTLSLNREIIDQAKKYAKKHKVSLSKLVENYFTQIIKNDNKTIDNHYDNKLTNKLYGILSQSKLDNIDFDEIKKDYLFSKYIKRDD